MTAVTQGTPGEGSAQTVFQSGVEEEHSPRVDEVLEQAKLELSDRYGFSLEEAFEVLSGLAKSQRCSVEELADSVVRTGGRLDGDLRGDSGDSVVSIHKGRGKLSLSSELLIEAPSAASAFVLAGSLAEYGARALLEGTVWRVVVDRCGSFSEGVPGALSRTRRWLRDSGLATTSVTLNGETYRLDGSAEAAGD